jgi:N-ethylmaleimide reductase
LIANEGFTREIAQQVIASGEADAVGFGKDIISSPDLQHRFKRNIELNPYGVATFFTCDEKEQAKGYTDYRSIG